MNHISEDKFKKVIVPKSNLQDIAISDEDLKKIKIVPVEHISEVLLEVMEWKGKESILKKIKKEE